MKTIEGDTGKLEETGCNPNYGWLPWKQTCKYGTRHFPETTTYFSGRGDFMITRKCSMYLVIPSVRVAPISKPLFWRGGVGWLQH